MKRCPHINCRDHFIDQASIQVKDSARGTFTSLTVTITATGKDQLQALHQDLMATGHVQMVI